MNGLLKWFRDSHPRALARPCLRKPLADRVAGCKEKTVEDFIDNHFLIASSEVCDAKFSKKCAILRFGSGASCSADAKIATRR